jgi:hypothetical protein
MFRKCFAALVALTLVAGGLFAEEIKGVFKKFEDGKVTISVDDQEKSYKVDKDAKVKVGKDQTEVNLTEALGKWKEGQSGTFTVKDDVVTSAKKDRKKKDNK